MQKIVFIDRGNIFRSPMAKGIYNSLKSDDFVAYSYGTNVKVQGREGLPLSDYPGIADSISYLKKKGIDITGEHCTQLMPEHLDGTTRIIVMTEREDIPEWLKAYPYDYWEIKNPDVVTEKISEEVFLLLKDKIENLF